MLQLLKSVKSKEFNFINVTPKGTAHLPEEKKIISETCSALWLLVPKLFLFGYDSSVMESNIGILFPLKPNIANHS